MMAVSESAPNIVPKCEIVFAAQRLRKMGFRRSRIEHLEYSKRPRVNYPRLKRLDVTDES
jgi:hypothetical protein